MGILASWNGFVSLTRDSFMIPHFNYIRGTSYFDCLFPLSSVIAISSAKIHKSHLGSWANLSTIDPTRVNIVDSMVKLKGPVWIVAGTAFPQIVKIIGIVGSASVGGLIVGWATYKLQGTLRSRQDSDQRQPSSPLPVALGIIAGIGSGVMASKLLGKIIPTTRGVFFYNFPSFTK